MLIYILIYIFFQRLGGGFGEVGGGGGMTPLALE